MKRFKSGNWRWTPLAALGAILVLSGPSHGDQITGIVSFGDSLSDVGNFYAAANGASPPSAYGYDQGRFTNGSNWVEYLAKDLGVAIPTASVHGGTDFAYGGAMTGTGYTTSTFLGATVSVPNVGQQVHDYLASNTPTAGQLYTIWGGANDVLNGGQTNPLIPLTNIATAIETLTAAGAKQFLVANMPPLNLTPAAASLSPTEQAGLAQFSTYFNQGLQAEAASLQNALGVQIHVLDVYSLMQDALAHPAKYGMINVNTPLIQSSNPGANGYLFWDTIHPTTQADQLIGDLAVQSVPEPSTFVLFAISLILMGGLAARRRRSSACPAAN
jgi:phospholipase/lecithinase/hemolysin